MFTSMTLQDIGNNVRVPCRAHGLPRPRVYWTKDGVLVNKPRFVFHENGDMEISNLQWADMGTYTCVAENSLGKESTSTFIYPMKTIRFYTFIIHLAIVESPPTNHSTLTILTRTMGNHEPQGQQRCQPPTINADTSQQTCNGGIALKSGPAANHNSCKNDEITIKKEWKSVKTYM
ncbi:unnamed protein product [Nesidiocoris tenuis]|uniref:Ig-like domain-containing protein n=1 Tax=Nesidiocoris tenuis TaxID=355587 RepID=A0A6H5HTS1_9HEMI|nr:unnamed protein product [Nesidiocoris tenuis]